MTGEEKEVMMDLNCSRSSDLQRTDDSGDRFARTMNLQRVLSQSSLRQEKVNRFVRK